MDTLFEPSPRPRDTPSPTRRVPGSRRAPGSRGAAPPRRAAPRRQPPSQADDGVLVALRFDPFPLWLAQRRDGNLVRVPSVVADEGRVQHANPAARRHGITRGMRLEGARLRVEPLTVVQRHEPDLAQAWTELLSALAGWSPWVAPLRRGLVLLRLPATDAAAVAQAFNARAGIAADRHSAELASATTAPGDLRRVDPDAEDTFLDRLPLRFLRAVGLSDGDLTRLHWLGLRHAGDLARWSAAQIRSYLGPTGVALLPYLHGPRDRRLPAWRPPPRLQRHLHADPALLEPYQLAPALERLAGDLAQALAGRGATLVSVEAEAAGRSWRATRRAKRPLTTLGALLRHAHAALSDSGVAAAQASGHGIERLCVELGDLRPVALQEGLWTTRAQREHALDAISSRFTGALVGVGWGDPHAPASDRAWQWRALEPNAELPTATGQGYDPVPLHPAGTVAPQPWSLDGRIVVLDDASSTTQRRPARAWPLRAEAA